MDISSENGGISSDKLIDYFTKQFLVDLKTMVATKEELAKRQGAIAAVEQTLVLKAQAEKALADATAQAESMIADAKALNEASKKTAADVKARQNKLDADEKAFADTSAKTQAELNSRSTVLDNKEAYLLKLDADLNKRADILANSEAALEARVKAFQEKVANLSA